MTLLDKISSKAGKLFATGLATAVLAGIVPARGYADDAADVGGMLYLAEQARQAGRIYEAKVHADGAAMLAAEKQKKHEAELKQLREELGQEKNKQLVAYVASDIPALKSERGLISFETIVCNNYKKQQGIREGPTTTFSRKEDEISVAIIVQSKAPYFAEITIMDEEGKKLDSEKWNENPTELSKRAHWLLYNIAEWRNGTFFVNFIAKSSDGEFNVIRQIKIN